MTVQRLGDGSRVCEDCWETECPGKDLPETGWDAGECDYCDDENTERYIVQFVAPRGTPEPCKGYEYSSMDEARQMAAKLNAGQMGTGHYEAAKA